MEENRALCQINSKIGKFDLLSLLRALESTGITLDKLLFIGSDSYTSQSSICQEVRHANDPATSAIVKLNLGLLTGASPLPSYFRKAMDKGQLDDEKFLSYLQFFNHHVIKNFVNFAWIEKLFVSEWKQLKSNCLHMFGFDSGSSLYWLFSSLFPELNIEISKTKKIHRIKCEESVLGVSRLGIDYVLGGYITRETKGYAIELRTDTAQTDDRKFWPSEIKMRLRETIFPLLRKTHIYLVVSFSIDQYHCSTRLNEQNFLGFTSLGETTSSFTWSLFEGYCNP